MGEVGFVLLPGINTGAGVAVPEAVRADCTDVAPLLAFVGATVRGIDIEAGTEDDGAVGYC